MAKAADSTNIVRLPTAATRKVQQPSNSRCYKLAKALPQHPAPFKNRWQREAAARDAAEREADAAIRQSPELLLALALYACANDDQRNRIKLIVQLAHAAQPNNATKGCMRLVETAAESFATISKTADALAAYQALSNGPKA